MSTTAPLEHALARTVREAMTRSAPHARVGDTVSQVARYMADAKLNYLVVVDGRNRVAGVVSQREVLEFYLSYVDRSDLDVCSARIAAGNTVVESLFASDKPHTVRHDAPLTAAALLMGAHGLGCLPVVDRYEELKGVLLAGDVLHEFSSNETAGLETGYEFFEVGAGRAKQPPAFVRRGSKELVVPLDRIAQENELADRVMLGFDDSSGRILVKFVPAGMKMENSLPIRRQADNLVIAAESFVQHFRLLDRSTTFNVVAPQDTRYLVLIPR